MANVFATKSGNWTDTTVWNGGALPTGVDDVYANNFTVTINTSPGVQSVRTTSAAGINAGGNFLVTATGFTLSAAVYAGTTHCVTVNLSANQAFTIIGSIIGGATNGQHAVNLTNSGDLNITGNITGGTIANAYGINSGSTGTLTITGNVNGGSSAIAGDGIRHSSVGTINVTGNVTGGANSGTTDAMGIRNNSTGTVNVTGNAIAGAGSIGVYNVSTGVVRVVNAIGNDFGLGSVGVNNAQAVYSGVAGSLSYVQKLLFGGRGNTPVFGPVILTDVTTNTVQFAREGGGTKTLVDQAATAGVLPAITDVRSGVIYSSGNRTGTCAVPAAGSVALGVAVGATTGTAILTASAIRTELTAELARMSNAATTQEVASIFQDAEA